MLAVALCLSAVAAFYSIVGLTAIFAASVIPVVIMGSILEVAKLVITVWLHEYWTQVKWVMRMYLIPAIVVLMFITSMGIFGFLSQAHIEQVGVGQENAAQLQRIDAELGRQTDMVEKAEARARTLETSGTGADANVNSQIKTEQDRIDAALARVQPAIDEQNKIIDAQTRIYQDQINKIDQQSAQLQKFIDAKEIDKAQALVGTAVDGNWGPGTAAAVRNWQAARSRERAAAVEKLEQANNNPVIRAAREEIARVRRTVEAQVTESNRLIDRLRNQLGKGDTASVETLVNEQQDRIRAATVEIETLTRKKYELQAEYRKLEVEVGPIKYIAELIYDTTDQTILEKAVRWVIILIVAVFDPLAVMMLLAATESRKWNKEAKPKYEPDDGALTEEQIAQLKEIAQGKEKVQQDPHPPGWMFGEVPKVYPMSDEEVEEVIQEFDRSKHAYLDKPFVHFENLKPMVAAGKSEVSDNTVETHLYDDESHLDSLEIKLAKSKWKELNPTDTLKNQRHLLELGVITKLPWMDLVEPQTHQTSFGKDFPDMPQRGDLFINTETLPTHVLKYNGEKWIEIDKTASDSYVHDDAYVDYLISRVSSGEYDPELLTDAERTQIELRLHKDQT